MIEGAHLGQPGQQGGAQYRPHAWHAVQQLGFLPPQLGAMHRAVDVTVEVLEPLARVVDMAADLAMQSRGRLLEPVLYCHDHVQQVLAPCTAHAARESAHRQLVYLELGPLCVKSQHARIDAVSLRELSGLFREMLVEMAER